MNAPLRSHASVRSYYFRELCADADPHIEKYELADFRVLWRMADAKALHWRRRATLKLYWQNANGTWSHHKDAMREWRDVEGCRTDLRFANEHEGQRQ